ncbi:hypothetical protein RE9431_26230 [Prescottella equi]|uniref:hypothetical protein n=1 Tax=Rhodococcus hoagii TaxID=43767 RepID=UPI0011A53C0E|nr:hypothetical protein [Prescottella equi]BCN64168.1 hypothetical protein RE9431_26230 [Prescottella equi]BCN74017.1 hypothetical protein RE0327_26160 [Prescottella equi]
MATRCECDGCRFTACDLPDGVDPADVFLDAPEGQVLCQGCIMAVQQDSGTWTAPVRGELPPDHDWEGDPIVVGDRPKTAAEYWRDAQAGAAPIEWDTAPSGGILGFSSEPFVQECRSDGCERSD